MSEALARQVAVGDAQRLIELLTAGEVVGADKLTRELAADSVTWIEPLAAEKVRVWWLEQWRRNAEEDEAAEIVLAWDAAANRVREAAAAKAEREKAAEPTATNAQLKAEIAAERAAEPEPKPQPEPMPAPAVVTNPALSPLLPGFEKLPELRRHRLARARSNG
jgi:hypothetical protein